jgi:hypothetical protein
MTSFFPAQKASLLAAVLVLALAVAGRAQPTNFGVTTPAGFQYFINGVNNTGTGQGNIGGTPTNNCPPLTLAAGQTYTFTVNVGATHPLGVVTTIPPSVATYSNASPQGITSGTVTLTIPSTNFPSTLYYQCNTHHFYGVITVVPPVQQPAPPRNTIISIVVTPDGVTVDSSGTNTTYLLVPQFNSNVVDGNWHDVPTFTNTFANGTNTTTFGRLDALCGSNVFVRISQRPPQ